VHHAHAALADLGEQGVAAHGRPDGRDGGRASRRRPRRAGHAVQTKWRVGRFRAATWRRQSPRTSAMLRPSRDGADTRLAPCA
jgi:hypothetical protein